MKNPAPSLAPLLRSNTQGDLLALLLLHPDSEFSLTEIGQRIGALSTTVHREVDRLVESGMLTDRRIGTARLVRANTSDRLFEPTRALIEATFGPRVVLESLLSNVEGIEEAFIFGSWAARYSGEPGHSPNDIDVLVVGTISRRDLAELAEVAEKTLHLEINMEKISPTVWQNQTDPFTAALRGRPLVDLLGKQEAA